MTRDEFGRLFESALETAATNAQGILKRKVPRSFGIRLHGAGHRGERVMDVNAAANALYLGENRFYRIIDVCVVEVSGDVSTVFVRASAHQPGSLEETWNDPPGSGPFKQLWAQEIKVTSS
jgi:hypothetical protein